MRYKIGDIARLFQLSTESIRHYERRGLIHPQKAEGSSYRYYQAWDMAVLSACRHYRALGFTLEESAEMLAQSDTKTVLNGMRSREEAIEKEIARQCQTLRTMRAWRKEVEATCALMNKFELEQNTDTYFLPYQYGDELTRDEEHLACVREWLSHIPYVYVGLMMPFPARGEKQRQPAVVGLGMAQTAIEILKPQMHESIVRLPARLCLHTAFRFESRVFEPDALICAMDMELKRRGLEPEGQLFCRFNVISWTAAGMNAVLDCFLTVK